MFANLFKSVLHNIGVLAVGCVVGLIGVLFDKLLFIEGFKSPEALYMGLGFLVIGFLIRVWATYYFYQQKMKVIVLEPQSTLFTRGPYAFSRNPLYLGGNFFIFFGFALVLGTISGSIITAVGLIATDIMIRREEKQLEKKFGEQWNQYKKQVRRWI